MDSCPQQCPVCREYSYSYFTHKTCLKGIFLDRIIVCYLYNDIAQKLIDEFKYKFDKEIGEIITEMMLKNDFVIEALDTYKYFIPIPLHEKRHNWRGFNQAEILTDNLLQYSDKENIENNFLEEEFNKKKIYKINLIKRIKYTEPQAKLKREKRLTNLENAFEVNSIPQKIKEDKKGILLIDDITTTTSTLNECAKVLKEAGVKKVSGLVFARGK